MAKRRAKRQLPPDIEPSAVAQRMADRVPDGTVGLPMTTVLTIFTIVLPLLLSKCGQDTPTNPDEVQAAVAKQNAENPQALLRRTATALIREAKGNGTRLTKADALVLARAAIDETVEAHADDVGAFCSFHM